MPEDAVKTAIPLAIAWLAAYVGLDLARRLPLVRGPAWSGWLAAAAAALGTGVWSTLILAAALLPYRTGLRIPEMVGLWLGAVLTCALALAIAGAPGATWQRHAAAGLIWAACAMGLKISAAVMLGGTVIPGLPALWLAAAAIGLGAAAGTAFTLSMRHPGRFDAGPSAVRAGSGALLAAALVSAQLAVMEWTDLTRIDSGNAFAGVPLRSAGLLASIGTAAMLLCLLAGSLVEARMRDAMRRTRAELHDRERRDPLTGLPNRQTFDDDLDRAVREADRLHHRLAVLAVDLDGFRPVNASYGQATGDRLLKELASRLVAVAGAQATVARLGGDQFLLRVDGNPLEADVARLSATLLAAIARPMALDDREVSLTGSIGIAMYPEHGGLGMLVAHADAALRAAKGHGGATYLFYDAQMTRGEREQIELMRDLRGALERGQLELYYQPKVHAPTGEITGAEALMRWHHPQRGMISPAQFIPVAERFGLIVPLGNWLIDEACRQARAWRDAGLRMRVAINLSVHQLRQPDLVPRIVAALDRHQINPRVLTCEITESVAMQDAEGTRKVLDLLAATGVQVSIDDFGTGYSSLSYLRKLPADELKIDRSFVLDLETSADARAVVDGVVKLAQALNLKVVAEGVETEEQGAILKSLGCDVLQGYLYAKPMSAKALALWAMDDIGPRAIDFRPSLFQDTVPQDP